MVKPIALYRGAAGLNTILDPQRISQGTKNQPYVIELAQAVDMIIDEAGGSTVRPGRSLLASGSYNSLACKGEHCFVAREWADQVTIEKVTMTSKTTAQISGVRSNLTKGLPVSFAFDGDTTWYSNGKENGYIVDGISKPWPDDQAQAASISETSRRFLPAPAGHLIAVCFGRMWVFEGNVLWYSEPFSFSRFNKSTGFILFHGRGRMIAPADNGLWVSDDHGVYFLSGGDPGKMEMVEKSHIPALNGGYCTVSITPDEIPLEIMGRVVYWLSEKGLCLGGPNGEFFNPGARKIKYPEKYTNGAICADETHFFQSMW